MDFINLPILLFSILLCVSILTSLLSGRIGIPLILIFLCIGLITGAGNLEIVQTLQHPRILFFVGSIALAMILFDSGFQTPIKSYKQNAKPAILLATGGVVLTALLLAPFVHWILDIDWLSSLLLVSIISSTDSAAVFFLLRSKGLHLREKIKSTLEIESGSNDPMAIFLTTAFIFLIEQKIAGTPASYEFLIPSLLQQACIGGLIGWGLFYLIKYLVNKISLETALYPIFVLGLVLFGFAVANILGGSGFLAVYVAGILVGNSRIQAYTQISKFQQTITWLSQISIFTCLGMFVTFSGLEKVWPLAFLIAIILMFFARPAMIFAVLGFFKEYSFMDKVFISFVGLRGATSVLLALMPMVLGIPLAEDFFNIIFVMVLISLAIQGFAIPWAGKICGVTLPQLQSAPQKTEIDLPGLSDTSLVMYCLDEQTPIIQGEKIPRWAKPILVIRNGISYPMGTGLKQLKSGDKVYIFISSESQRPVLDKLFGRINPEDKNDFGDFPIAPETTFEELEKIYGIKVNRGIRSFTIAELFAKEFSDIEIGDRLILDSVELVVHSIEEGQVTEVGIDIDPASHRHPKIKRILFFHKKKN
ncbi:MAG: potassium/proton antiporter [Alphaproteobacteria bacterium]